MSHWSVDALEALHIRSVVAATKLSCLFVGAEHCPAASVFIAIPLWREAGEAAHVFGVLALALALGLIIIANINIPGRTDRSFLLLRQLHLQNRPVTQVHNISQSLAGLDVEPPPVLREYFQLLGWYCCFF